MIGKSYQVELLGQMLRQAEMQHRITSQNIANVNTPGYRTLRVDFGDWLNQLEASGSAELSAQLLEVDGLRSRPDGNNVDIDREMSTLTKNAIHFEVYAQLLASKIGMLRSAITGS